MENLITGFKIHKPHGLQGELKVSFLLAGAENINLLLNQTGFIWQKNYYQPVVITTIKPFQNKYLIRLKDLNDINLITPYIGSTIYFDQNLLQEYQIYATEKIIGYKVMFQQEIYGIVQDIRQTKAHAILEINLVNDENYTLIPWVDEYVKNIDPHQQIVYLQKVI